MKRTLVIRMDATTDDDDDALDLVTAILTCVDQVGGLESFELAEDFLEAEWD